MSPDLCHTIRSWLKHSSLFFPGDLRVKRQDSVSMTTFEGQNIRGITMSCIVDTRPSPFCLSVSRISLQTEVMVHLQVLLHGIDEVPAWKED